LVPGYWILSLAGEEVDRQTGLRVRYLFFKIKRLSEKLYRAASSRNGENVIQLGHEKKTISSRLQTVRDEPGGIDAAEL
jgi:hypothetical protein